MHTLLRDSLDARGSEYLIRLLGVGMLTWAKNDPVMFGCWLIYAMFFQTAHLGEEGVEAEAEVGAEAEEVGYIFQSCVCLLSEQSSVC